MRSSHLVLSRFRDAFKVLGLLGVVLFSAPVQAQDTVVVSTSDCRLLTNHVPADDVTYRPGVDVRGREVAPADLGGGYNIDIPEEIHIDIGIDLADRLGLREGLRSGADPEAPAVRKVLPYEGKASLGLVTIKGNEAYWNGERISPQDQLLLTEACLEALDEAGLILPTEKPAPQPEE